MGQVNLYKIDENKKSEFIDNLKLKYKNISEKPYSSANGENKIYNVCTYIDDTEKITVPEWQWILDECDYPQVTSHASPKAILVVESTEMYALTYGLSYFAVDKYADVDFAFDFIRRKELKQVKTTTLTSPNSQRNKMVNVYVNYDDISYDSGESYAKMKVKVENNKSMHLHGELMEVGRSIKTQLSENSIDSIIQFIEYVEEISKGKVLQKIPVFRKVKDNDLIDKLDKKLLDKIEDNMECISISELDIIGVTEVFNNNDTTFLLKYNDCKETVEELTKNTIETFIKTNNLNIKSDFMNIKVVCRRNGEQVCTHKMKNL